MEYRAMVLRAAGTYTPTTGLVDALSGSSNRTSGRDALLHDIADRAFRLELGSLEPCGLERLTRCLSCPALALAKSYARFAGVHLVAKLQTTKQHPGCDYCESRVGATSGVSGPRRTEFWHHRRCHVSVYFVVILQSV